MDPYQVLRLNRNCTLQEVKAAYRRMAQLYHPDGKHGDLQRFHEIKQSYDALIAHPQFIQKQEQPQQYEQYEPTSAKDLEMERIEREAALQRLRKKIQEEAEKKRVEDQKRFAREEILRKEKENQRQIRRAQVMQENDLDKTMRQQYEKVEKNFQKQNQAILHDMKTRQNWYCYNEDKAKREFDKQAIASATFRQKVVDFEEFALQEKVRKMQQQKRTEEEAELRKKQQIEDEQQQKRILQQAVSYNTDFIQQKIKNQTISSAGIVFTMTQGIRDKRADKAMSSVSNSPTPQKTQKASNSQQSQQASKDNSQNNSKVQSQNQTRQNSPTQRLTQISAKNQILRQIEEPIVKKKLPSQLLEEPECMQRIKKGEQLTLDEQHKFHKFIYEKELLELKERGLPIPTRNKLNDIIGETHRSKYQCLVTQKCVGNYYEMCDNVFQNCGIMNPFVVWEKYVRERQIGKDVNIFMEHYDIPVFDAPENARTSINAFFQAKYGMFYCQDNSKRDIYPDYSPTIIQMFEKSQKQMKRTWSMAIMAALVDNTITFEDLQKYENNYTKGHRWIALQRRIKREELKFKRQQQMLKKQSEMQEQKQMNQMIDQKGTQNGSQSNFLPQAQKALSVNLE
eukprot:403367889